MQNRDAILYIYGIARDLARIVEQGNDNELAYFLRVAVAAARELALDKPVSADGLPS